MTELLIEVDEHDKQIWLRPRSDFLHSDHIHRASHLILFNTDNEILLQLRAKDKKTRPDLYTFSVDGTVWNESYEDCIMRETQEELWISVEAARLFTYATYYDIDKAWRCVFVWQTDQTITPDFREMQKIRRIDANKLQHDIQENPQQYTEPVIIGLTKYFDEFHGRKNP